MKCQKCSAEAVAGRSCCDLCAEKNRMRARRRLAAKRDEINARRRSRSTAAYQRAWRERNIDKVRASDREYYAKTREKRIASVRKWQKKNRLKLIVNGHNRRARMRGAAGGMTTRAWDDVLTVFGGLCAYCGADDTLTRDHVYPLPCGKTGCKVRHGKDEPGNVVPACNRCNPAKGHRDPKPWIKKAMDRVAERLSGAM